jgi:polysaccharide export outer membrane protein
MLHTLLSLVVLISLQTAAPSQAPVPVPQGLPQALGGTPATYVIGPSDVIAIKVFNEDNLSCKCTVDTDGSITMNLIGRFPVAGKTTREIEDGLVKALQPAWLKNAQVSVEIADYRARSIYVLGEVRSPGRYEMKGPMTLLEVIANAGSTTATASNMIVVQRYKDGLAAAISAPASTGDERWAEVTRINLEELREGKLSANLLLQDSDMIIIPAAERYYVSGMVKTPGSYVLRAGMTVRQAIAEAGGLTERGTYRRLKVIRKDKNGNEKEDSISLSDPVRAGDVIKVAQRLI